MMADTRAPLRILAAVIAFLTVVLGGGLLLPKVWSVDHEMVIAAPPAKVYSQVIALRQWHTWCVVHVPAPDVTIEYSGPESGTGATYRWIGQDSRGVMKIMDTLRDRRMEYELLLDGGARTITGSIRMQPEGQGTRVAWQAGLAVGANPLERYAALLEQHVLGRDVEASLVRLKSRMESPP